MIDGWKNGAGMRWDREDGRAAVYATGVGKQWQAYWINGAGRAEHVQSRSGPRKFQSARQAMTHVDKVCPQC